MKILKYILLTLLGLFVLFVGVVFIEGYLPLYKIQVDKLSDEIGKADKIVVREYVFDNRTMVEKTIFSSTDKKDIIAFQESLLIERPKLLEAGTCACMGSPKIVLFQGDKELVTITNHHSSSIRTDFWETGLNIPIVDEEKWITWFDKRGINSLRKNYEEDKARAIKSKKDTERWVNAMPQPLKELWSKDIAMFGIEEDVSEYRKLLNQNIPNKKERISLLLHWFGSGAGPWSGYPAYESVAEDMLLEYKIEDIVSFAQNEDLTTTQVEGVARLLGGWDFSKKYPKGLEQVPKDLKKRLWEHVKTTKDDDKLGRAKRAFSE